MNVVYALHSLRIPQKRTPAVGRETEKLLFSRRERAAARRKANPAEGLTARLAAKQAFCKAVVQLGYSSPIDFRRIEILNDSSGKPFFRLLDGKLKRFSFLNVDRIFLSLTHTRKVGCAFLALRLKRSSGRKRAS